MVRAHLKQTVSFCGSQVCYRILQPHPDNHRSIVAGFVLIPVFPRLISTARRQEESDGEEEGRDWLMALQDQRV